jgi:hypothetical protein
VYPVLLVAPFFDLGVLRKFSRATLRASDCREEGEGRL